MIMKVNMQNYVDSGLAVAIVLFAFSVGVAVNHQYAMDKCFVSVHAVGSRELTKYYGSLVVSQL